MEPRWSYLYLLVTFLWQFLRLGEQAFQKLRTGIIHMLLDLRQQMLQIFVDLQIVGLGSLHQTVDRCAGFGTVEGTYGFAFTNEQRG